LGAIPWALQEVREIPIIWAVHSIFGVTQKVDIKFTKKFGMARMKVAVLNPDSIPEFVELVIGDYVYELQFRVEREGDELILLQSTWMHRRRHQIQRRIQLQKINLLSSNDKTIGKGSDYLG
jgi:hypothetical protein